MTNTAAAAKKMNVADLIHVARTLEAELLAFFATGGKGTHAHLGKIELLTACTDELVSRGYLHGSKADGSDLPRDVHTETTYGSTTRLSFAIRCF